MTEIDFKNKKKLTRLVMLARMVGKAIKEILWNKPDLYSVTPSRNPSIDDQYYNQLRRAYIDFVTYRAKPKGSLKLNEKDKICRVLHDHAVLIFKELYQGTYTLREVRDE